MSADKSASQKKGLPQNLLQRAPKRPETQSESSVTTAPLPTVTLNDPAQMRPQEVMTLQSRMGNQSVQRLLNGSLAPGNRNGMASPGSAQAETQAVRNETLGGAPVNDPSGLKQTTQSGVQRKSLGATRPAMLDDGGEVAPEIGQAIQRTSGGAPLDKNTNSRMSASLGLDLSGVRVHTDARADTLARSLSARAFTTGSDIFFKQGEYDPTSRSGQHLLAHELTHVGQQGGADIQTKQMAPDGAVQRKSDKLPQKADLRNLAKSGTRLFGTSLYGKILNAVDDYHSKVGDNDYLAQLNQLINIHGLLVQWQVSHGTADSSEKSKNKKEGQRRDVLASLRTTHLPGETADVYQQAKQSNTAVDIHMLMTLMEIMDGNPGLGGAIERDYAAALHGYTAGQGDLTSAQEVLEGAGSTLFDMAGGLDSHARSVKGLSDDPSDGRMDSNIMDAPIAPTDSDTLKEVKRERRKLRNLVPALGQMSETEIKAIGSYTDESGYIYMNAKLRGLSGGVKGKNKNERKSKQDFQKEVAQAILMTTSALNRLPDWDGSTLYRGETIGWAGGSIRQGATITFKSFTSTSANPGVPQSMSGGSKTESAVWEISGVTNQGKDISKLTVQQKKQLFQGGGQTEDEVLLLPYTSVIIDSIDDNHGQGNFKYLIKAHV